MLKHTDFCLKCREWTPHTNFMCDYCSVEQQREEEKRWESLTLEQRIEELKKRIDAIEMRDRPLG